MRAMWFRRMTDRRTFQFCLVRWINSEINLKDRRDTNVRLRARVCVCGANNKPILMNEY